jgi:prepilin-type processing-associated H-X9-DG protein
MNGWLNPGRGVGTVSVNNGQRVFRRDAEIGLPSEIWVTVDERIGSINDGWFAVAVDGWTATATNSASFAITDWPANYHNKSTAFSFADGHVETHRWLDATTIPQVEPPAGTVTLAGNPDVLWLMMHATTF